MTSDYTIREKTKECIGGIAVRERKLWLLTYADNIVLMADVEEELKEMLKRFEKFLKKTKLQLVQGLGTNVSLII